METNTACQTFPHLRCHFHNLPIWQPSSSLSHRKTKRHKSNGNVVLGVSHKEEVQFNSLCGVTPVRKTALEDGAGVGRAGHYRVEGKRLACQNKSRPAPLRATSLHDSNLQKHIWFSSYAIMEFGLCQAPSFLLLCPDKKNGSSKSQLQISSSPSVFTETHTCILSNCFPSTITPVNLEF